MADLKKVVALKNRFVLKNNIINILPNPNNLFALAAEDFAQRSIATIQAKGEFSVVLSGGDTPKFFFDALTSLKFSSSKEQIPWRQIKFFFGDERYVPSSSVESNYHMAYEHLFSKVPVLMENIYRIPTDFKDPKEAAREYELTLRKAFHLKDNEFPKFDLLYLGLGEDAHTASLMPFSEVVGVYTQDMNIDVNIDVNINIAKNHCLVDSLWVPEKKMYRITLTPPAINNALNIVFLVVGVNKASAVWSVLEGASEFQKYPAQLIQCVGNKNIWYLDEAAASQLGISKFKKED